MSRRPIVAANWKMHKTVGEAVELAAELKSALTIADQVETVLCPAFTALKSVGDLLQYSEIELGGQDVHWENTGAYTGEVSAMMLVDVGCRYVIIGHSERRASGETDEQVRQKIQAALNRSLDPIVCVGETLEQRDSGRAEEIVREQLDEALTNLPPARLGRLVVAYEPVWAIGTGHTATPDQVQAAHSFIRKRLRTLHGDPVADAIRIQYGGSVKPENARQLFELPDVDGGLIGGASLSADSFIQIVHCAHAAMCVDD